jgi:hypothetical protein
VDREKGITVITCTGKISAEEVFEAIELDYREGPTMNHIWVLEDADLSDIRAEDVRRLALTATEHSPAKAGGKTALVSSKDVSYGLGRMFSTFTDLAGHKAEYDVFRTLDEARAWMESQESEPSS